MFQVLSRSGISAFSLWSDLGTLNEVPCTASDCNRNYKSGLADIWMGVTEVGSIWYIIWAREIFLKQIVTGTKCLSFCRRNFQVHFLDTKCSYCDPTFNADCPQGSTWNLTISGSGIYIGSSFLFSTKPPPESMTTEFADAYIQFILWWKQFNKLKLNTKRIQ